MRNWFKGKGRYSDKSHHILSYEIAKLLRKAGIPASPSQVNDFLDWLIRDGWAHYEARLKREYEDEQEELDSLRLSFPNGKKGIEYDGSIHLDLSRYDDIRVEGADLAGLTAKADRERGLISLHGTPEKALETEIEIIAKPRGWREGDRLLKRALRLTINPDPKDLWKSKPVPPDTLFPKDDEAAEYLPAPKDDDLPQKTLVAASKRGRSHAQEGLPRDDDFRISRSQDNGWYILVVADGAGSAKYSREGSRIASETVEAYCREYLAEKSEDFAEAIAKYHKEDNDETRSRVTKMVHEILFKAAVEGHRAIEKTVKECKEEVSMKDFGTTLLAAVCRRFSFGWFVASFGVGDGAIAIYDKAKDVKLLNDPDGGEYAGQTRFLTMTSIFEDRVRLKMSFVEDFTALMLMTDGISDPYFETDDNLGKKDKWDALWGALTEKADLTADGEQVKAQLLEWLDFWSKGNHDDRTIAILY